MYNILTSIFYKLKSFFENQSLAEKLSYLNLDHKAMSKLLLAEAIFLDSQQISPILMNKENKVKSEKLYDLADLLMQGDDLERLEIVREEVYKIYKFDPNKKNKEKFLNNCR